MKKKSVLLDPLNELVALACGHLYGEAAYPEVGMGMGAMGAVNEAATQLRRNYGEDFLEDVDLKKAQEEVLNKVRGRIPGY
jgi:hypothetical protein